MAKVPLRKYNSEIEALTDRGQVDEAIAHARHILRTYPKHLETYRLLGKAYLEAKRFGDASDIFNRVLMAAPDDFVSHVGLSIIADEGKRLDDAIWHMERALEKQPSNAAIHSELQRLYGRRDGREPPKIRLTRGALAHMYVQGELFPQAIAEARAVLAEDPSRTDLQTLLALAYFRSGQKVDASEACTKLINQFPYCLDANRALVEILPGTGMAESAAVYKQRVIELDPYAAYAGGSIFQTAEVPDASVTVERLDYKNMPPQAGADWDKSLAIGFETGAAASAPNPDWMRDNPAVSPFSSDFDSVPAASLSIPEPAAPFSSRTDASSAPDENEDGIPDWMQKAGWGQSTGAFDESKISMDSEPESNELAPADLPDWIKSMAPVEQPEPAASPSDNVDWLNKLGGENPFNSAPALDAQESRLVAAPAPESETAAPAGDFPDWLSELGAPMKESAPASTPEPADWLSQLDASPEPKSEPAAPAAGLGSLGASDAEQDAAMAWLESLAAKQGANPEELITDPNARAETAPDWVEQAKAMGESIQSVAKDETPDESWLAGLGAPEAAVAASTTADWLSTLSDNTPEDKPSPVEHSAAEAASATADWPSQLDEASPEPKSEPAASAGLASLGASESEQDAAMAWLESLAAKQGANPEELITDPNARTETAPDWVEQIKAADNIQPAAKDETPDESWLADLGAPAATASTTADWLSQLDETASEPPTPEPAAPAAGLGSLGASEAEQDAAMAWLESLAAKQGAKSEELITDPNARTETAPDWVEQAKAVGESIQSVAKDETQPTPEPMPEATPASLDQTGVWLRDLDEQDASPAALSDSNWLRNLEASEKAQEAPAAQEISVIQEAPVATEAVQWSGEIEFTPPPTGPLGQSASEADLPTWLRGLESNTAESSEPVAPSVESLPDWLRGEEPEAPRPPAPTRATDWTPEAAKPAPAPKPAAKPAPKPKPAPKKVERKPEPEPAPAEDKPKLRRTGMLPPLVDPSLAVARDALSHGKIPDALQAYGNLIRKGKLLEDVTFDLKEALYRFPVEVSIWQALGDAYMRANRLQDALDAYTKAEELLR